MVILVSYADKHCCIVYLFLGYQAMQCGVTVTVEIERAIGNVSAVECCSKNFGRSIKKDIMNKK